MRTRTALAFDLRCEAAQLPVAVAELLHDAADELERDQALLEEVERWETDVP